MWMGVYWRISANSLNKKIAYASQYFVALRQPSVIYVKVNSLGFSSRSSSCSHLQFFQNAAAAPPRYNKVGATSLAPQIIYKRKRGAWFFRAPFNVARCIFLLSAALPMFVISTELPPVIPVCHFDRRREAPKWRNLSVKQKIRRGFLDVARNGNKWRKKEHGFFPCSFDYCALLGAEGIKVLRARKF